MAKQLKASDYKFLFLFDGFDELKQPINLYDTNQLGSWGADVKIIVTSRNLTQFSEYAHFFMPNQEEHQLTEYAITPVDDAQIAQYVNRMYLSSFEKLEAKDDSTTGYSEAPIARQGTEVKIGAAASAESKYLRSSLVEKLNVKYKRSQIHYQALVEQVKEFRDVIKTPYLMKIIIDILPKV